MASTIADLVWTFRNVKVAPHLNGHDNVVTAIDYTVTLVDGDHKVWRFGNAVLATSDINQFVMLDGATKADIAAMAIKMAGKEQFDNLFAGMQTEIEQVKQNGALDTALKDKLPFAITLATPADIAASAAIPPDWKPESTYAAGAVVKNNGKIWTHLTDDDSEPRENNPLNWRDETPRDEDEVSPAVVV